MIQTIFYDRLFPTLIQIQDNILVDDVRLSILSDIQNKKKNEEFKQWQSKANLHNEKLYSELTDTILKSTKYYFDNMQYVYEDYEITDMWANVYEKGEMHRTHGHSNNMLSGVFYVSSIDAHPGITFLDPRPAVDVLVPTIKNYNTDNSSLWQYNATQNRLMLFPSWLKHYVPVNETDTNRVSISFNVMFRGKLGSSDDYSSGNF